MNEIIQPPLPCQPVPQAPRKRRLALRTVVTVLAVGAVVYADQGGTARLVVSGVSGAFTDEDPGAELTESLHAMGVNGATTQDSGTPAGGSMRCGTLTTGAGPLTLCMWADHSSLVTVTVPVENEPVTFEALAGHTRALRAAMEVPKA
ncbi:hypothetical protein ACFXAO_05240 [Streptomyces lavendulae]|uniref:hypothetical protein n=1 Tax=Streptomyces lavendulae TaxID=1914 RepID=UPI0036C5D3F4